MKKLFLKISSALFLFGVLFTISCQKNDVEKIDKTDELKFVNLTDLELKSANEEQGIGIITITLWRESRNCLSGFGICHIEILGWEILKKSATNSVEASRTVNANVTTEDNSNNFVDLELANSAVGYSDKELILTVENDMETLNAKGQKVVIVAGKYSYDKNIGKFGGYRIPVFVW